MTKESSFHSTPMKNALIYTDAYLDYNYGPMHPLRAIRLKLTFELIKAYGLLELPSVQIIPTVKADEEDLALFHSEEYIEVLKQGSDGYLRGDEPIRIGSRPL